MKKILQVLLTIGISVACGYFVLHRLIEGIDVTRLTFLGLLAFCSLFFFTFIGGWTNSLFNPYGD